MYKHDTPSQREVTEVVAAPGRKDYQHPDLHLGEDVVDKLLKIEMVAGGCTNGSTW